MTIKETFIPWQIDLKGGWDIEPLTTGAYLNTVFGHEFWGHQPSRYPDSYYDFLSTKARINVFLGQRVTWMIPDKKRKTAKSILVSAAVRLASFTLREIQDITDEDNLELSKLGERKQAIFCVIPDSNDVSLNFLVGMLYTQAFQELYYQADKVHMGGLPVPVRLMFDEFANVALPDGYARLQATMRSRNIMATIILQNISQLKALFKDDWEGIIGNADTFVYLGGNEQSTHKYISEQLGKETIDTKSSSQSKGRNGSFSQSFQQTGRDLMTPDEVRLLDNKNAIVFIRGERPVIDEKYDLMKHPNVQFTEDGGAAPYVHSPHCLYDMRYLLSTIETEESV